MTIIDFDAYVYFYPLIIMDLTRKQSSNLERADPPADFRTVVRPTATLFID